MQSALGKWEGQWKFVGMVSSEITAFIHVNPKHFYHPPCTMEKSEGRLIFPRQWGRPSEWGVSQGVKNQKPGEVRFPRWNQKHRAWEAETNTGFELFLSQMRKQRGARLGAGSRVCLVAERRTQWCLLDCSFQSIPNTRNHKKDRRDQRSEGGQMMEQWDQYPPHQTSPSAGERSDEMGQPSALTKRRRDSGKKSISGYVNTLEGPRWLFVNGRNKQIQTFIHEEENILFSMKCLTYFFYAQGRERVSASLAANGVGNVCIQQHSQWGGLQCLSSILEDCLVNKPTRLNREPEPVSI